MRDDPDWHLLAKEWSKRTSGPMGHGRYWAGPIAGVNVGNSAQRRRLGRSVAARQLPTPIAAIPEELSFCRFTSSWPRRFRRVASQLPESPEAGPFSLRTSRTRGRRCAPTDPMSAFCIHMRVSFALATIRKRADDAARRNSRRCSDASVY